MVSVFKVVPLSVFEGSNKRFPDWLHILHRCEMLDGKKLKAKNCAPRESKSYTCRLHFDSFPQIFLLLKCPLPPLTFQLPKSKERGVDKKHWWAHLSVLQLLVCTCTRWHLLPQVLPLRLHNGCPLWRLLGSSAALEEEWRHYSRLGKKSCHLLCMFFRGKISIYSSFNSNFDILQNTLVLGLCYF